MEPQAILNENKNSKILNLLSKIPYTKRHTQRIDNNFPNNFRGQIYVKPESHSITVPTSGQKYKFKIPEAGFLRNILIKTVLTCGNALDDNTQMEDRLGIFLYSEIELSQNGRTIFFNNPSYILNRIVDSEQDIQQNLLRLTQAVDWVGTTPVTVFTPLFSFIFDNEDNNILLDWHKELELIITVGDVNFTNNPVSWEPSLIVFRTSYETDFLTSYINDSFIEQETNFLTYDIRTLKKTCAIGDTSCTVEIKVPCLVSAIHLALINTDRSSSNITGCSLKVGSKVLIETEKLINVLNTDTLAGDNGMNEMSVYLGNKSRNGHSGSLDMSGQYFDLTVTFDSLDQAAILYVNLEHLNILTSYRDNGRFSSKFVH